MPELTGPTGSFFDNTDAVDTVLRHSLGTRAWDKDGNEFIYLKGLLATIVGTVVTFDEVHITAIVTGGAVGRVAVAMAAVVADRYGWYQIYGKNEATGAAATVLADTAAYIDGTDGLIDDDAAAGDWIAGMIIRSTTAASLCTVELNYPSVCSSGYLT